MNSPLQPCQLFGISSHVGAIVRGLLFIAMSVVVTNSMAWGTEGHQVIAAIAQAELTTKASTEVNRLLALEPGETLQSISTWPDEHRGAATGSWHYVNFPRETCTYDAGRDCPDGNCVVGAIAKQLEILTSNAPDEARLKALKYVVHFVADVHQPLHARYFDDKGGNKYQLQAFGHGTNLHALWDSGLIKNLNQDTEVLTKRLLAKGTGSNAGDLNVVHAAEESCKIVGTDGFYPVPGEKWGRITWSGTRR